MYFFFLILLIVFVFSFYLCSNKEFDQSINVVAASELKNSASLRQCTAGPALEVKAKLTGGEEAETISGLNGAFRKMMGVLSQSGHLTVGAFMLLFMLLLPPALHVPSARPLQNKARSLHTCKTHHDLFVARTKKKKKKSPEKQNLFVFLNRSQNSHVDSCS